MKTLKKLTATAMILSMAFSMPIQTKAALREKDIVWVGSHNYEGRTIGAYVNIEGIYEKNVVYVSSESSRKQIYFGKTGEKTGFIYKEVVPLAGGTMFFVTESRGSYKGYIVDDEGNEIYTGLKNVADHINGAYGIKIKNSGIKGDRYICGETKEGLVILDTGRDCKVIRAYKCYALGTKDEIYKTRVNKRRYILITNKKKTKRAFMWLSQKSGVSEIIAENFNLKSELLINKDGEHIIADPIKNDDSYNLYNTKRKLIWNGKNKEITGVAGNVLNTPGDAFRPNIDPPEGAGKEDRGTKIIFNVNKNGKYGLVRDDGKQLLAYKYSGIDEAYKDMAVAGYTHEYHLVNYRGKKLTTKKYEEIYSFNKGKAVVEYDDKYGVISDTGKELVKPIYDNIIGVKFDGQNSNGKYVYSNGKDISEGMILIKGRDYIYEDKNGKQKELDKVYDSIQRLADSTNKSSSLFAVTYDGKFGIMSANGKEIYKTKYDFFSILDKKKGIFTLASRKHGKSGDYFTEKIIDRNGKKLFEISHVNFIKKLSTGEYLVIRDKAVSKDKNTEQILIYSSDWKKILSLKNKWDNIVDYKDGLFIIGSDYSYGLIDSSGKVLLPEKYYELKFKGDCIQIQENYENAQELGFLVR